MIAACHHPRCDRSILTPVSGSQSSLRRPLLCDASVWGRLVHTLHLDAAERISTNGWTSFVTIVTMNSFPSAASRGVVAGLAPEATNFFAGSGVKFQTVSS